MTCVVIGCSTQGVPSSSQAAMRSPGGTNCRLPFVAVALTNSVMAFLAGPSLQEGKGSAERCAVAQPTHSVAVAVTSASDFRIVCFKVVVLFGWVIGFDG